MRKFSLGHFNILARIYPPAAGAILHKLARAPRKIPLLRKALGRRIPGVYWPREFTDEDSEGIMSGDSRHHFHVAILDGYWQDYKPFESIWEILRDEFSLKDSLSEETREYLKLITSTNSVSIHVRRGDMQKDYAKRIFRKASSNYFLRAISILRERTDSPTFFVFCTDLDWAKSNLRTNARMIFVESDGPDYEHLYLISRCKSNIIDSSTFSWWGAWLNPNPAKIVVAPERWVVNPNATHAALPDTWIRLEN